MLQLAGPAALSAFRIAKLLERLRALEPTITGVAARFMHFIDLSAPLTAREQGILAQLLTYGPRLPLEPEEGEPLLVVPRAGTISPWSSKATDIAQVCGLAAVRRIERGIAYRLRAPSELGAERLADSVVAGESAYDVESGYLVQVPDQGPAPTETSLLADYLLNKL